LGPRLAEPRRAPSTARPSGSAAAPDPRGSRLTVDLFSATAAPPSLHFAVRDTGCGIPADRLDRLFRAFSQVDASTTRRYGGTGLGLVISKKLAEIMGGRIWLESEPGKGSVFQFVIPLHVAVQPEAPPGARIDWSGKRVLIVDDNATHRRVYDAHLRHWGLETISVATSHQALDCLRLQRFDLAIFDFDMPDLNGIELAQLVTELRLAPGMRVILSSSSGSSRQELQKAAEQSSFDAFLPKPTRSDTLRDLIGQLLSGAAPMVRRTAHEIDTTLAKQHPLRILLAEDNVVNQKVVVAQLKRMGYHPDVVANGLEVLAAVQRQTYDVILMDVQMPEMDGLEASQRIIKGFDSSRRPRLIALTANVFKSDQDACLAAGMDGFLGKPLDLVQLREALLQCQAIGKGLAAAAAAVSATD
jgi:CheY-like chemotaxis protein